LQADVLARKVGAGVLSGTVGSVIAHPLDVIKVRMQAASGGGGGYVVVALEVGLARGMMEVRVCCHHSA
jgi:hypothetical protein